MDLRDALHQIEEIRRQMACVQLCRVFRSATAGFSALLAIVAAVFQPVLVPDPVRHIQAYVLLWGGVAILSLIVTAIEMTGRYRRSSSQVQQNITRNVAEQFVPCLIAGAALTFVLVRFAAQASWLLPGLWAILFSMGIFSLRRLLPGAVVWVARYYLAMGLLVLTQANPGSVLAPWVMGVTFALGQSALAVILYWTLERPQALERANG